MVQNLSKTISRVQLNGRFTLRFGLTDQLKVSSETLWIVCVTSPAVWGPSADSSRHEVQRQNGMCANTYTDTVVWLAVFTAPSTLEALNVIVRCIDRYWCESCCCVIMSRWWWCVSVAAVDAGKSDGVDQVSVVSSEQRWNETVVSQTFDLAVQFRQLGCFPRVGSSQTVMLWWD